MEDVNGKLLVVILLLVVAVVPVSIAVDLLVWPGDDKDYGSVCGIIWLGILPVGGYCA